MFHRTESVSDFIFRSGDYGIIYIILGCTLPLLVKKIGLDPAVMASPIITTVVDAIALIIFFGLATTLLGI